MRLELLDSATGELLVDDSPQGITFGSVRRGEHSAPVLIRLVKGSENQILGGKLMLGDVGGLMASSEFGAYTSFGFTGGVNHENLIVGHLSPSPWTPSPLYGQTGGGTGIVGYLRPSEAACRHRPMKLSALPGADIGFTGSTSQYIWLDVDVGLSGPAGDADVSYRVVYDYN